MMKQTIRTGIILLLTAIPGKLCFAFQLPVLAVKDPAITLNNTATGAPAASDAFIFEDTTTITGHTRGNYSVERYKASMLRLKQQAVELKKYAIENNYSTDYCFLVDMSVPSGKKRFFVYNFKTDSLEVSSLVSHGHGSFKWDKPDQLEFSNEPWSLKTSVGKYKIGASYNGHYGLAYKLYGLDSTNNKAFDRAIVLHSYKNMSESETYPAPLMESIGCPAVPPSFLSKLNTYIKPSKKPILMWIYN